MNEDRPVEQVPQRTRRTPALIAAFAIVGLLTAGLTAATAQEPSPSAPAERTKDRVGGMKMKGPHGFGRGALHGEFTTRAPGGGFQVLAMQNGEVTAVDSDSITVKSEDDFTRTYVVNDDTMVNAGDEGIADVKRGDTVHVIAIVEDGDARAVRINDATQRRRLGQKWMPRRAERKQMEDSRTG